MRRLERDVTTLNPICTYDSAERHLANYLFTPLINLDHRLQPSPGVAASWKISNNHLHYQFTLNSATFSDGTRVRASDVLFTLRKITDPSSQSFIADSFNDLDLAQTRIIDEKTIDVVFRRALVTQLTRFADVYVMPEHVYGTGNFRRDFNATAIGSGPYRLVSWRSGQSIVLTRRDDYWKELPPIRNVVFTVITDHEVAWRAFLAGAIDETFVPSEAWQRESANPRRNGQLTLLSLYRPGYNFIAWNAQHPLLQDKRVRRALSMAVPVQQIVDHLYHGRARAISGPFTPDDDAYNHSVPPLLYAPDRARRLLTDAGWRDRDKDGVLEKDGKQLRIVLQIMPGMKSQQFAQLIQLEFRRIGVHLEISLLEPAVTIQLILQGKYDAAYLAWNLGADPDLYSSFHSSQVPPHGKNFVFYANPEVDQLIEKARTEFDRSKRQQLHHRLHTLLAEDQPYTWVVQPAEGWAVNKRVQNAYTSSTTGFSLWYPGDFGWWIDPRHDSSPVPVGFLTPTLQPTSLSHRSHQTVRSQFDAFMAKYENSTKQPWFWPVVSLCTAVGIYLLGIAAILMLAWTRGSHFIARSRLRKAALAPLHVLPVFARWVLLFGYKRRLMAQTSLRAAGTYFGLPAALDDGEQVLADMTGAQLHAAVAANVAQQRPLFVIGTGGSGKSTLLTRLAHLGAIDRLPEALRGHVPVLVDAADYSGDLVMAIAAALRDRFGVDVGDEREHVIDLLQSGRFLILFDGLSEVFGDPQQAWREIVQTATGAALRTCRVIVATRELTGHLANTRTIELQPLNESVIETVFDHYKLTASAKNRLRLQISSFAGHTIEPLLFMMMLQASSGGELARSRSTLYERYFRLQLKVSVDDEWLGWCDALETLAAQFFLPAGHRGFGMTHAQLIDFLDGRRGGASQDESMASRLRRMYHLHAGDALGLLNSLANARILIRDRRVRFAHDTFEEYFVARAIVSRHAEGTWSPPEWFRDSRHRMELETLARFVEEMTDENPLDGILVMQVAHLEPSLQTVRNWRFDEGTLGQFWLVDDDVQQFMQVARPLLERAFLEILADPLASPTTVVRGKVIHIKRLPSFVIEERLVPSLLLAYTVRKRDRLIGMQALCRAADTRLNDLSTEDERVHAALQRMLGAMQAAKAHR